RDLRRDGVFIASATCARARTVAVARAVAADHGAAAATARKAELAAADRGHAATARSGARAEHGRDAGWSRRDRRRWVQPRHVSAAARHAARTAARDARSDVGIADG